MPTGVSHNYCRWSYLVSFPRESEILVENRNFYIAQLHSTHRLGRLHRNIVTKFGVKKTRMLCLPGSEKVGEKEMIRPNMFACFHTIHESGGRTDRRSTTAKAAQCIASRGKRSNPLHILCI